MEGTSSSSFPASYVTLKDLQERWIKRKQEEENEEKLRRLREEEEIKLREEKEARNHRLKSKKPTGYKKKTPASLAAPASNSQGRERKKKNLANGFNANEGEVEKRADEKSETSAAIAGRRKDRQQRRITRKQEENEEKLRRFREEEEIKPHKEKEANNHRSKSKNPSYSDRKSPSSPAIPASHSYGRERKEKNLANGFNANQLMVKKDTDAKSETSAAIADRRMKKRRSRRSQIPPSESESVIKIGDKKEEEVLESAPGDQMAEICLQVADLSVGPGGNWRSGRISGGGGFRGRRYGGTARVSASGAGMVWVRKTS